MIAFVVEYINKHNTKKNQISLKGGGEEGLWDVGYVGGARQKERQSDEGRYFGNVKVQAYSQRTTEYIGSLLPFAKDTKL